jgi:para-nitrobenzyl esterase
MRRLCLALVLASCASSQKLRPWSEVHGTADPKATRQVAQGTLVGFAEKQGNYAWLGVPYAQPPTGPLRWKAPRPALAWQGTREATTFGNLCPQLNGPLAAGKTDTEVAGSEDCLTLNIFTPAFTPGEAAREKRPVMFWIHGGGNTIGTSNVYGIARNFALKHGVVVVSINYRLGVLGWFHHPALVDPAATPEDNSGNYATLDLIEGLRWVQANAAAFGGDPTNVTVFGESAGGFNVFSLLASPLAKGLFHRAISQSGIPSSATLAQASHFIDDAGEPGLDGSSGEVLLAQLLRDGKAKNRADAKQVLATMSAAEQSSYLRARSPEQLIGPFKTAGGSFGMYRSPALLRDGHVLPPGVITEALAKPPAVPVLLGTNRDEFKLFMLGNPKYVTRFIGLSIRDEVVFERDAKFVADLWRAVGTDAPAAALQSAGAPVFAYRFDWDEEPKYFLADLPKLLGAAHGLEIGFVFDDEASEFDPFGINTKENELSRVKLARAMHSYWVQFARTGSPGRGVDGTLPEWPSFGEGQVMLLDTEAGGGIRPLPGVQTVDEVEQRVWNDKTLDEPTRCESLRALFRGFAGLTGAWSPERAARITARRPSVDPGVK